MTFEVWVEEHGFVLADLTDEMVAALRLAYEAETGVVTEPTLEKTIEIVEPIVDETVETIEANAEETKEEEPKKPAVQASGSRLGRAGNPARRQVPGVDQSRTIEASMLMSNGVRDHELESLGYDPRTIDTASSRQCRGIGLQALCYRTIQAAGLQTSPGVVDNDFIRTAFEASNMLRSRSIRASGANFSTVNLPGILSNVANKTLLKAYSSAEGVATKLSVINSSKDFKSSYAYTFGLSGELQPIGDGGEIKHLSMIESEFQNRIDTRGAMVACTRQMIINDDLGAFLRIATELGRKAAHSLEKTWWSVLFENHGYLFHSDYDNAIDAKLNIAGLTQADKAFSEQTGPRRQPDRACVRYYRLRRTGRNSKRASGEDRQGNGFKGHSRTVYAAEITAPGR